MTLLLFFIFIYVKIPITMARTQKMGFVLIFMLSPYCLCLTIKTLLVKSEITGPMDPVFSFMRIRGMENTHEDGI
jgi:hypothetical protein